MKIFRGSTETIGMFTPATVKLSTEKNASLLPSLRMRSAAATPPSGVENAFLSPVRSIELSIEKSRERLAPLGTSPRWAHIAAIACRRAFCSGASRRAAITMMTTQTSSTRRVDVIVTTKMGMPVTAASVGRWIRNLPFLKGFLRC